MHRLCELSPVQTYSDAGFAFAGGEVRVAGPVLMLPDGVFAWPAAGVPEALSADDLAPALAAAPQIDFILLGTGAQQVLPAPGVRAACAEAGLGLEVMATGAACRTIALLLGEQRLFAAALVPAGRGAPDPGAPMAG